MSMQCIAPSGFNQALWDTLPEMHLPNPLGYAESSEYPDPWHSVDNVLKATNDATAAKGTFSHPRFPTGRTFVVLVYDCQRISHLASSENTLVTERVYEIFFHFNNSGKPKSPSSWVARHSKSSDFSIYHTGGMTKELFEVVARIASLQKGHSIEFRGKRFFNPIILRLSEFSSFHPPPLLEAGCQCAVM